MLNRVKNLQSTHHLIYGLIICILATFFYCYEFVLRIIPGILQSELSVHFGHISAAMFGQISALYYFAYSPMQLPVGMLMDRFGPRRLLTIACACCCLGSYMFAYETWLPLVGFGRFLVGFGSSFAFVGVLTLSTMWLPKELFSLFAGIMTTLSMLGNVYAEMKITKATQTLGLNAVLMGAVLIGAILTLVIFASARDNKEYMQQHKTSLKPFFKEVFQILSSFKVWMVGLIGACLYTSLSVFGELWGQTYLEQAHQLTKTQSAHTMSMLFIGWAIGAPLSGYLSDKFANRVMPLFLGAIGGLISIYTVLYVEHLSYTILNMMILFYGIFTSTEIIVFVMGKEISKTRISGTVFAVINMIVTLLGAVLQPTVGWILDLFGHRCLTEGHYVYQIADYQKALSVLPLSMVLVILLCFIFKEPKKHFK
ncbi:MAG: MFS transporter [Gammaproteobacteria bacterium]|nr:MFS transporter [Gammaproteobacteria bacterium]